MEWDKTVWESDLDVGLRTLRLGVDTHAITSHFALPLLIETPGGLVVEVNDGTDEYNADQLPGLVLLRPRQGGGRAHGLRARPTSSSRTARPPCRSRPAGCGPRRCSTRTASPRTNWRDATKVVAALRHLRDARVTSAGPSPRWPRTPTWPAGTAQSLSSGQLAKVYGFTDLDGSQPDAWRYLVEVQDAGKPADVTGYR